jgi:putative endonuclease
MPTLQRRENYYGHALNHVRFRACPAPDVVLGGPEMMTGKKELGKKGEDLALRFLKKRGYRIIEQNYVCKMGEMDLIAKEKDTLVFIEVKTRTSMDFGPPQLAVTSWKQRQLSKVALYFLKEKKIEDVKARFDVVAVLLPPGGEEIELIRDAFDLNWP